MLHPGTAKKIKVLKIDLPAAAVLAEMEEDIERAQIPDFLGGGNDGGGKFKWWRREEAMIMG